jgi:hypothetical protein
MVAKGFHSSDKILWVKITAGIQQPGGIVDTYLFNPLDLCQTALQA